MNYSLCLHLLGVLAPNQQGELTDTWVVKNLTT